MPLKKVIQENIETEIEAGKPPKQAAAIAYSKAKRARRKPSELLSKEPPNDNSK